MGNSQTVFFLRIGQPARRQPRRLPNENTNVYAVAMCISLTPNARPRGDTLQITALLECGGFTPSGSRYTAPYASVTPCNRHTVPWTRKITRLTCPMSKRTHLICRVKRISWTHLARKRSVGPFLMARQMVKPFGFNEIFVVSFFRDT